MKERDRRALDCVMAAFDDAEDFCKPYREKFHEDERLLKGYDRKPKKMKKWQTERHISLLGMVIDLLVPRLFQGLPAASAKGRSLEASLNEENLNQKLNYDQERMGLEMVLNQVVKDGCLKGLGVFKTGWRTETMGNIPHTQGFIDKMMVAMNEHLKFGKVKSSDLLYDGPDCAWVDPNRLGWDPTGSDEDSCSFLYEVSVENTFTLMKDPSIDRAVFEKIKNLPEMATQSSYTSWLEQNRYRTQGSEIVYGNIQRGLHEIIRYSGAFDIDNDGLEEMCQITVIDRTVVGSIHENPYRHGKKNYIFFIYDKVPGQLVGRSMTDRVAELQEEYNDAASQSSDMRKLTLLPMLKFKVGSIAPQDIKIAPGMPIPVTDVNDLVWDRPPDFTNQLGTIMSEIRELVQLMSGANDVALGQQDVGIGDNTATGATIAQEQTEMRFKQPAIILDLAIQRYGDMLISNEQQFTRSDVHIPVKDSNGTTTWTKISPKNMSGQFDYQMESGSLMQANPTTRFNQLVNGLKIIQNNPNFDQNKLIEQALEALKINPDTLKVLAGSQPPGMPAAAPQGAPMAPGMPQPAQAMPPAPAASPALPPMPGVQSLMQQGPQAILALLQKLEPDQQQILLKALKASGFDLNLLSKQNDGQQTGYPSAPSAPSAPAMAMAPGTPQASTK